MTVEEIKQAAQYIKRFCTEHYCDECPLAVRAEYCPFTDTIGNECLPAGWALDWEGKQT